jgi:hypothetical protein
MNVLTPPSRAVAAELLRVYRLQAIWFWITMVVGIAVAATLVAVNGGADSSIWLMVAGTAAKYWLLVIGVMVVTVHLRMFVANGITRRDVSVGGAAFAVVTAAAFTLVVILGQIVEHVLLAEADKLPAGYPALSPGGVLGELGRYFPMLLAYLVTGALISVGFYRLGGWRGMALLVPGLLPLFSAEFLLGLDDADRFGPQPLPYAAALAVCLGVIAAGVVGVRLLSRDMPIRRPAG